jgi:hypothetical protein
MADLEIIPSSEKSIARLPNFEPTDIGSLELFAKIISNSELAPKDYRGKLENCMVAMMMGRELGLSPIQALQGIAVINGRPSVWGDAMWALVVSHPEFMGFEETVTDAEATCTVKRSRRGALSSVTETFSLKDANFAGLIGRKDRDGKPTKTPWDTYPKRMMMWRARTFAARSLFPDALKGLTSYEEASDYIDGSLATQAVDTSKRELPSTAATSSPTTDKGGQAKPEAQGAPAITTISPAEVKEFTAAWKEAGWDLQGIREFMKDTLGVSKSGDIPAAKFSAVITAVKEGPKKVEEVSATPSPEGPEDNFIPDWTPPKSALEEFREQMNRLEMLQSEQFALLDRNTKNGTLDLYATAKELSKRLHDAGLE